MKTVKTNPADIPLDLALAVLKAHGLVVTSVQQTVFAEHGSVEFDVAMKLVVGDDTAKDVVAKLAEATWPKGTQAW